MRIAGGDMKFLNGSSGLNGNSAKCPCPWCNVKSTDFTKSILDMPYYKQRDFVEQIKMAHCVVPGLVEAGYPCPCCKEIITCDKDRP